MMDRTITKINDVKQPYQWSIDECYLRGIGKNQKEFEVTISKKTAAKFEEWLNICYNNQQIGGYLDANRPFVFYDETGSKNNGKPIKNPYYSLWRLSAKASIELTGKRITPHMIRHTLGHHLRVDKNKDIVQIKTKLRHTSIATTQIYTDTDKEEMEKLDKDLFEE